MKRKNWHTFAKSHNLVNRIYNMLEYLNIFENCNETKKTIKKGIYNKIRSFYYVESLAKYFEDELKKNKNNVEVRCNLVDLIHDLDFLKQYLVK